MRLHSLLSLALAGVLAIPAATAAETKKARTKATATTQPIVVSQTPPEYPMSMRRYAISGQVLVEFIVDSEGKVASGFVVESDNPTFDEPAIEAVLLWKFKPGTKDGKPVPTRMQAPIVFSIEDWADRRAYNVETKRDPSKLPEGFRFDVAPKIKSAHVPVYPYALRHKGTSGKAQAGIVIDAKGRVVQVKVLSASAPEFGLALYAALENFRFVPATLKGEPVASVLSFEQEFDWSTPSDRYGDDALSLEKRSPEKIVAMSALDKPLNPRSRRSPAFPLAVPPEMEAGQAVIECLIDKNGRVRLPRIASATHEAFGYAAVQAANSWWFDPPLVKGKPAVVRVQIPFTFGPPAPKKAPAKK
ncbi:MAG TPA: TonB family protein [Opitutaceae bacterium]